MEYTHFEFTEKELAAMQEVSSRIDISHRQTLLQYGAGAQKLLKELLAELMDMAQPRDPAQLEDAAAETMSALRSFDMEERKKKGILGLFSKKEDIQAALRRKQEHLTLAVQCLGDKLEAYQLELMKTMEVLRQKSERGQECLKMLAMYIRAGKMKLARERETTLANMREIARRTELPRDAAAADSFEQACRKFELKLRDLEQTGNICSQMQPAISQLKAGDAALSEALHKTLLGPVAQWKQTLPAEDLPQALEEILQVQQSSMAQREAARKQLQQLSDKLQQKVMEVL